VESAAHELTRVSLLEVCSLAGSGGDAAGGGGAPILLRSPGDGVEDGVLVAARGM